MKTARNGSAGELKQCTVWCVMGVLVVCLVGGVSVEGADPPRMKRADAFLGIQIVRMNSPSLLYSTIAVRPPQSVEFESPARPAGGRPPGSGAVNRAVIVA